MMLLNAASISTICAQKILHFAKSSRKLQQRSHQRSRQRSRQRSHQRSHQRHTE